MGRVDSGANKVPNANSVYVLLRKAYSYLKSRSTSSRKIFQDIYRNNSWGGGESVSGRGSDIDQAHVVINELPLVLQEFGVHTLLDIPCGDYNWMQHVDLSGIEYLGADIVDDLVKHNSAKYENEHVHFQCMNLIKDKLPCMDLVFCRDCLVHLSFQDIFLALNNICNSRSKYLLTTTFTNRESNKDILTGQWRALNFECAPFFFPKPIKIIVEGCTEGNGIYQDKSLGLWRLQDVRECLMKNISIGR